VLSLFCSFRRALTATVLVLTTMMATPAAWAMSNGCAAINDVWGAGITVPNVLFDIVDYQYYLYEGETVTYYARSQVSPFAGGNVFQLLPASGGEVLLEGSTSEVREVSGVRHSPFHNADLRIHLFSNRDTSIFAKVTCEGTEPKIESISPSTTSAAAPEKLVIRGKNLSVLSSLTFGSFDAKPYVRSWNATEIEVELPAQAVGTVNVVASSTVGSSVSSAASKVTFALAPDAPTISTVSAVGTTAEVAFSTPASNSASIIDYTVVATPGNRAVTGSSSPLSIAGLDTGTSYTFTVTARNIIGSSGPSQASDPVLIKSTQSISFPPPAAIAFGTTTTLPATASSGFDVSFSTPTPNICQIDAHGVVTPALAGDCIINADQAGDNAVAPATRVTQTLTITAVVPQAPVLSNVAPGNGSAVVAFNAPSFTGGEAISAYRVNVTPGGAFVDGSSSPITVPGLTNGIAYRFSVTANNSAGPSSPSNESGDVTPKATQTITLSDPGTVRVSDSVTLTAMASSGMTVALSSLSPAVCTIDPTGAVTLLRAGTCSIAGHQAGDQSVEPAPPVNRDFTVLAMLPGAPTNVSAVAAPGQATISFTPPVFTGGVEIDSYTVIASPGGARITGNSSPILVVGLTDGTDYSFTVTAVNGVGSGSASLSSAAVTPQASQVITFINPGPQMIGAPLSLTASSSAGLPVSFTSQSPAVCATTVGGAVTLLAAGSCVIDAAQPGDAANLPAATVTETFLISATQLTLAPTGGALAATMVGNAYALQLTASGQSGALVWSLRSGRLPDGLSLSTTTGLVSGTPLPSAVGTQSFEIAVTDQAGGGVVSASYSILVSPREIAGPAHTITVPSGSIPAPLDLTVGATGGPFSSAQIISVEPELAGTVEIIAVPAVLQFTPNPQYTGQAIVRYTLTSAIGTSAPLAVSYSLSADVA
jgi:hypothetical protein